MVNKSTVKKSQFTAPALRKSKTANTGLKKAKATSMKKDQPLNVGAKTSHLTSLSASRTPTRRHVGRMAKTMGTKGASMRNRVLDKPSAPSKITKRQRCAPPQRPKKATASESTEEPAEKRLRRFRDKAPQSYQQKLFRADTQRMIVLKRTHFGDQLHPSEEIEIVGSTGNVYTVTVSSVPSCTCPDHKKGNECKHKIYALRHVLKAPEHLQYQLAFLSSELQEIFARAPAIPTDQSNIEEIDGRRKPVEGECPICYMDLDGEHNSLVWCKAACGNNMHKSCFEQWAVTQRGGSGSSNPVPCVYCRTPWQFDSACNADSEAVKQSGSISMDGYVNVADQFGISRTRDYSTYYPNWARRQMGHY